MKLAILPNHEYYKTIAVKADLIALRLPSQLGDKKVHFKVFDSFLDQEIAEKYNYRAINDALAHVKENQSIVEYKGISLLDLNVREIWAKAFSQVYREALCFLSCAAKLTPTSVLLEEDDPWLGLFGEIAGQLGLKLEKVKSFGEKDAAISSFLGAEYPSPINQEMHLPIKVGLKKRIYRMTSNLLASIVRLCRGRKPFAMISFFKPLNLMRRELFNSKKYHLLQLESDWEVPASGADGIISAYLQVLEKMNWRVEGVDVSKTLRGLLAKYAQESFVQIAGWVDALDKMFRKNKIIGYLGYCDTPWQYRAIIRLCQKHRVPNTILINGFLNNSFYYEGKTVDRVLVYGGHTRETYLKERSSSVVVTGTPLYDAAFARRSKTRPAFPPKKILVGTYDFSLGDINCEYACSEKYLNEVIGALKEAAPGASITLKLHPGESRGFYEWYLKDKGYDGIGIISGGDMQEIMSHYDLLIIGHSVALFEAALMGLPVIFYNASRQIMFEPFTGRYALLPSANNEKELVEVLKKIFSDKKYAYSFTELKALEPFTGPVDGGSSRRIINAWQNI